MRAARAATREELLAHQQPPKLATSATRRRAFRNATTPVAEESDRVDVPRQSADAAAAIERRLANYERREMDRRLEIREVEDEIAAEKERRAAQLRTWTPEDLAKHEAQTARWMQGLAGLNGEIQAQLVGAEGRTGGVMGESRADLLRAFKARLFDGQQQLLDLRRARESACSAWIERTKTLEASLDYAHETCATLRRNSAALDKSNAELRRRGRDGARTRERQLLEVVLAKRETEALRQALAVEDDEEPEARRRREKRLAALEPNARAAAAPERLVELRAAIDSARARAAAARAAYAGDVQVQTELRALLDTFAGDVRHQLERRKRKAHARPTSASAAPRVREKPDTLRISASTNALAPAWARSLPTKSPRPSTAHPLSPRHMSPPRQRGSPEPDVAAARAAESIDALQLQLRVVDRLRARAFPPPPSLPVRGLLSPRAGSAPPQRREAPADFADGRPPRPSQAPPHAASDRPAAVDVDASDVDARRPHFSSLHRGPDGGALGPDGGVLSAGARPLRGHSAPAFRQLMSPATTGRQLASPATAGRQLASPMAAPMRTLPSSASAPSPLTRRPPSASAPSPASRRPPSAPSPAVRRPRTAQRRPSAYVAKAQLDFSSAMVTTAMSRPMTR